MTSEDQLKNLYDEASALAGEQQFDRALEMFAALEKQSREAGNMEMRKQAVAEQGYIHVDKLKNNEKAFELFSVLEVLGMQTNDGTNLLIARYGQAVSLAGMGTQFGKALDKFEEVETMARQQGQKKILFSSLARSADIYFQHAENYERTLEKLEPYEALCRESNNLAQLDSAMRVQALCFEKLERYQSALNKYADRKALAVETGRRDIQVFCLVRSAYILTTHQERFEESLRYYAEAEPICREIADMENLKACLQSQSFLLRHKLKRYEEALEKYAAYEALCRQQGLDKDLIGILSNQAWIHMEQTGNLEEAMKCAVEMEALAIKLGDKDNYINSLKNQVSIHQSWGEKDLAKEKKRRIKEVK